MNEFKAFMNRLYFLNVSIVSEVPFHTFQLV